MATPADRCTTSWGRVLPCAQGKNSARAAPACRTRAGSAAMSAMTRASAYRASFRGRGWSRQGMSTPRRSAPTWRGKQNTARMPAPMALVAKAGHRSVPGPARSGSVTGLSWRKVSTPTVPRRGRTEAADEALYLTLASAIALGCSLIIVDLRRVRFMGASHVPRHCPGREFSRLQEKSLVVRSPSARAKRVIEICGLANLVRAGPRWVPAVRRARRSGPGWQCPATERRDPEPKSSEPAPDRAVALIGRTAVTDRWAPMT